MRPSAHLPLTRHRRPILWIALAAAVLMILSAAFSWAVDPPKISRTARVILFMRAKAGWTLDFAPTVEKLNQKKSWIFYYVTARTKHIDKVLLKELEKGAQQVVILGAGYDTRGYRFYPDFPKARFIEVDLPGTVADKEKTMKMKLPDMHNNVV